MIKCNIYIANDGYGKDIFVQVMLPYLPNIGSELIIGSDLIANLENQVKKSWKKDDIQDAYQRWTENNSLDNSTLGSIDNLSFSEAISIVSISFIINLEIAEITLGKPGDWLINLINELSTNQINYIKYKISKTKNA